MGQERRLADTRGSLVALVLAWLAVCGIACASFATTAPTGDGFTRGWNRVGAFLGWKLVAFAPAFVAAALVWRRRGALERRWRVLGLAPLVLELAFVALLACAVLWARFSG